MPPSPDVRATTLLERASDGRRLKGIGAAPASCIRSDARRLDGGGGRWPRVRFEAVRGDVKAVSSSPVELAPGLNERVRAGRAGVRFVGTGELPNFFRRPYGPGWVLVGDPGYHKDPITAQGISDAFRGAELVVAGDRRRAYRSSAARRGARGVRAAAQRGRDADV